MSTQGGSPTALESRQHFEMLTGDPATTRFNEFLPRYPDEVGHLQRRPIHLFISRRLVLLSCDPQRQCVQRTGGGAQMAAGKVDVESGFFQIAVTEQHLDSAQVGTRFVEVSRKTMAKRVHMHGLVEARTLNRMVASSPDGFGVQGLRSSMPTTGREKPHLRLDSAPVLA